MPSPEAPGAVAEAAMPTREFAIALDTERMATRAAEDERIPLSFSSEQPVMRYDWMEGERYFEVLDHSPKAVDLSYARDGLPFLLDHDTRQQVGIIEDVTVGQDRRLRGMLRLSRSQSGQELRQDILDGIRKKVSVGYRTGDTYDQTGTEGETPTRRYRGWMPLEGSSVAVPADYSVGYGRSAHGARRPEQSSSNAAREAEEHPMPEPAAAAQPGAAPQNAPVTTGQRDLRAEALEITRMCRAHNVQANIADSFFERGLTPDQVAREILSGAARSQGAQPATPPAPSIDISPRERRDYSIGRAILAMINNDWSKAGYEREISQALGKRLGRDANGILIPTDELSQRTTLSAGGATTGSKTVFTQPGSFIELLRNKSVIMGLGPMTLTGLQGNVALPRQSAAGTAQTVAELPGADAPESNMQFDDVVLSPKTIIATESYSKQLFRQSELAIDTLMRADLTTLLALLFDKQCLSGDGSANGITGIYNIAGVGAVAFGGAITFASVVDMETTAEVGNALLAGTAYVTTPEIKGKAKQKAELANTIGRAIWTGGATNGEMNGYQAVASNQLPKNLGVGTNEHGIIFGAFSQAIQADWGAIDITVDPLTGARQSKINITADWFVDFALRHPEAFVKGTGLTNT